MTTAEVASVFFGDSSAHADGECRGARSNSEGSQIDAGTEREPDVSDATSDSINL